MGVPEAYVGKAQGSQSAAAVPRAADLPKRGAPQRAGVWAVSAGSCCLRGHSGTAGAAGAHLDEHAALVGRAATGGSGS